MPNILIVGFNDRESLDIREHISVIMRELGIKDAVTTTLPNRSVFSKKCSDESQETPYLVVRATKKREMLRVARALNNDLHLEVEGEVINLFLAKKPKKS